MEQMDFLYVKDGMQSGSTVQDQSGQGNNLTLVGSSVETTQDTPSNNFCTLNASQRSRMNTNNSGDF